MTSNALFMNYFIYNHFEYLLLLLCYAIIILFELLYVWVSEIETAPRRAATPRTTSGEIVRN